MPATRRRTVLCNKQHETSRRSQAPSEEEDPPHREFPLTHRGDHHSTAPQWPTEGVDATRHLGGSPFPGDTSLRLGRDRSHRSSCKLIHFRCSSQSGRGHLLFVIAAMGVRQHAAAWPLIELFSVPICADPSSQPQTPGGSPLPEGEASANSTWGGGS